MQGAASFRRARALWAVPEPKNRHTCSSRAEPRPRDNEPQG